MPLPVRLVHRAVAPNGQPRSATVWFSPAATSAQFVSALPATQRRRINQPQPRRHALAKTSPQRRPSTTTRQPPRLRTHGQLTRTTPTRAPPNRRPRRLNAHKPRIWQLRRAAKREDHGRQATCRPNRSCRRRFQQSRTAPPQQLSSPSCRRQVFSEVFSQVFSNPRLRRAWRKPCRCWLWGSSRTDFSFLKT